MLEAGVILINKPAGPTSFAMIRQVRRLLGIKKVGHAGTLDPFASGLLVVCIGRPATRMIESLMDGDKEYEALLQLGIETETQDPEGAVTASHTVPTLDSEILANCLDKFQGPQLQMPPKYSALKYKGKPLYYYARRGIAVPMESKRREILIHELENLGYDSVKKQLAIRVRCGRGTYIRSLGADIGSELGCGAHLIRLRRTGSGFFSLDDAMDGSLLAGGMESEDLQRKMIPVDKFMAMIEASKTLNEQKC